MHINLDGLQSLTDICTQVEYTLWNKEREELVEYQRKEDQRGISTLGADVWCLKEVFCGEKMDEGVRLYSQEGKKEKEISHILSQ